MKIPVNYYFVLKSMAYKKKIRLHNLFTQPGIQRKNPLTIMFIKSEIANPFEDPLMYANNVLFSLHKTCALRRIFKFLCNSMKN